MNVAAVALICSNCAVRSGCAVPSRAFCSACSRKPSPCSSRPTVDALTGQPWTVNAPPASPCSCRSSATATSDPRAWPVRSRSPAPRSARLDLLDARPPGARSTNAPRTGDARRQLPTPVLDRLARQARGRRHHGIAPIPERRRFCGRPQPAPALIEQRGHHHELGHQRCFEIRVALHRTWVRSRAQASWQDKSDPRPKVLGRQPCRRPPLPRLIACSPRRRC